MKTFKPHQVPDNILEMVQDRMNEIDNCEMCNLEFEEGVQCRAVYNGALKYIRLYCIQCFETVNKIFTVDVEITETPTEN